MLLIIAGLLATTATAQAAVPEEGDAQICVSIAHMWSGTNEDISRIETVPVPSTYRRQFENDGCSRWQLVEDTLIDWHLAFGSEHSVAAALAYLESDYRRNAPSPERLASELERAWAAAEREYRPLAEALRQGGDPGRAAEARLSRSPRFRRLRELATTHKNYLFLADQYLRAAELFESGALLAKAASFEASARAGFSLLYRDISNDHTAETTGLAQHLGLWGWQILQMQDVEMRLAILRARLSRNPADIEAAQAILDRHFSPLMRGALARSYDNDGSVCDDEDENIDNLEQPDPVQVACGRENFVPWRVIHFWRNQLHLDLIKASLPDRYGHAPHPGRAASRYVARGQVGRDRLRHELDLAPVTNMLERAVREHPSGPTQRAVTAENLVAIYVQRANLFAQLAESPIIDADDGEARADLLSAALDDLVRGVRFAPPTERPTIFRQIASRYLVLFALARSGQFDPERPRRFRNGDQARHAVYFRETVRALDAIATGAAD